MLTRDSFCLAVSFDEAIFFTHFFPTGPRSARRAASFTILKPVSFKTLAHSPIDFCGSSLAISEIAAKTSGRYTRPDPCFRPSGPLFNRAMAFLTLWKLFPVASAICDAAFHFVRRPLMTPRSVFACFWCNFPVILRTCCVAFLLFLQVFCFVFLGGGASTNC